MNALQKRIAVVSLLVGFFLSGCGGAGPSIVVSYDRPAEYEISETIRRIGIAEFGGTSHRDKRWGNIASDKLASALDFYNRQFNRYELVDRRHLKAILDERDLQMAIADTASAATAGRIANVQAMIYGTVHVDTRDQHRTRKVPDIVHQSIKTVSYIHRYCLVSVNFTMDDITTARTLVTHTATLEYDSQKDKESGAGGIAQAMGFGGDKIPPADQVVNRLIEQSAREFVNKISPHRVRFVEELRKGNSQHVRDGNEFAAAGEYSDALRCYRLGIDTKLDDHGAMFNAGLMCEMMGDLAKGYEYYDKAVRVKVDKKYIAARRRVELEKQSEQ